MFQVPGMLGMRRRCLVKSLNALSSFRDPCQNIAPGPECSLSVSDDNDVLRINFVNNVEVKSEVIGFFFLVFFFLPPWGPLLSFKVIFLF